MREAFARAKARCEIRDDLQMEVMLDMLTGPSTPRPVGHATDQPPHDSDRREYVLRVAVRR